MAEDGRSGRCLRLPDQAGTSPLGPSCTELSDSSEYVIRELNVYTQRRRQDHDDPHLVDAAAARRRGGRAGGRAHRAVLATRARPRRLARRDRRHPGLLQQRAGPTGTMPSGLRVVTANQPITQAIDTLRALLASSGREPTSGSRWPSSRASSSSPSPVTFAAIWHGVFSAIWQGRLIRDGGSLLWRVDIRRRGVNQATRTSLPVDSVPAGASPLGWPGGPHCPARPCRGMTAITP